MEYDTNVLINGCREYGISLTDEQIHQFIKYYELLISWNKKMNLTSITEYRDVVEKHFLDSLAIVKHIDLNQIHNVIDVGTGAGFPGIPIKLVVPHVKVTLLDSLNKRIIFLNEVINTLNLNDIESIHGRAEDFGHAPQYREKFDICVSRAVAYLPTLCEYCLPFIKVHGSFVSYKTDSDEEIENAKTSITKLGGILKFSENYVVPNTNLKRRMIIIEKNTPTNNLYPRKAGIPSKKPIL